MIRKLPVETNLQKLESFTGSAEIADWAKDAMKLFIGNGYVGGADSPLSPKEIADRAQMAQILYNLMTK